MKHPRIERAEYAQRETERIQREIDRLHNEAITMGLGMTQEMQEGLVRAMEEMEIRLAKCEAVYQTVCPWLLEKFGDAAHEELRQKWPGLGWNTRVEQLREVIDVRHYLLPITLESLAPSTNTEYGICRFIRYANDSFVFGLGYAPEIDTLWYWWRERGGIT